MSCANDDFGVKCKNCTCQKQKVIAVIPVHGRHPLIKHTISRLLNKNGCHAVICAGSIEDKKVCEESGAIFIEHSNIHLGRKWNASFLKARELKADAVLFVGSSDWVSDKWVEVMLPYLKTYDMVGKAGCHLLDIKNSDYFRLVFWPGYKNGGLKHDHHAKHRVNESIGIGRMISKAGLDKIDWKPFTNTSNNSLDWEMYQKLPSNIIVEDDTIHSMAVSCDQWPNKHTFEAHWQNHCPSDKIKGASMVSFLEVNFPEYSKIFKNEPSKIF